MRFVNTLILGILLAATAPGLLAQTTQPAAPPASKSAGKSAKKSTTKKTAKPIVAKATEKPADGEAGPEGESKAGRRDPFDLRVGDAIDFWRVERLESGHLLRLAAEMKLPGRLWLQFEVDPAGQDSVVRQTTVFDPFGYVGLAYWYLLYPVHHRIFRRMLRGIQRAAAPGARARPSSPAL